MPDPKLQPLVLLKGGELEDVSQGLARYLSCVPVPQEDSTLAGITDSSWVNWGRDLIREISFLEERIFVLRIINPSAWFLGIEIYRSKKVAALVVLKLSWILYNRVRCFLFNIGEGGVRGDQHPSTFHYMSSVQL